jgi:hypothetical protein
MKIIKNILKTRIILNKTIIKESWNELLSNSFKQKLIKYEL